MAVPPLEMKLLGKVIGTTNGWEQLDDCEIQWIDPKLNDFGKELFGDQWRTRFVALSFDWEAATFSAYDDEGNETGLHFSLTSFN